MNTFSNDGSFMEQFLKRQKVSSGDVADASAVNEGYQQQQQQQYGTEYTGYDQSGYYQQPQQQEGDLQSYYASYYQQQQQQSTSPQQQQQGGYNNNYSNQYQQQQGGYNNNNNNNMNNSMNKMDPTRVVWVGNVHGDNIEDDIRPMFSQFGYIEAIRVVASKFCAFVTFSDINAAIQAQYQLNGTLIRGNPLKLGFGNPESSDRLLQHHGGGGDREGRFQRGGFKSHDEQPSKNLWLGNISPQVTQEMLRSMFEPFGKIDYIRVLTQNRCAFVNYFDVNSATYARSNLNGSPLCGMPLKINFRKEEGRRGGDDGDRDRRGGPPMDRDRGDRGDRGDRRGGDGFYQQQQQPQQRNPNDNNSSDSRRPPNEGGGEKPAFRRPFRENQAPMPTPPPRDPNEQIVVDKFAEYVARVGPRMETLALDKQKNNPLFKFLNQGNQSHEYYRWKLWTIKNPDAHSATNDPEQQQQQQDQLQYPTKFLTPQEVEEFRNLLERLTPTKLSISGCKNWIMSHLLNSLEIISIITSTFQKVNLPFERRLNILHVLNDCLHNTINYKKPNPDDPDIDFAQTIKGYLEFIVGSTSYGESNESQQKVLKVLNIWEQKQIYPPDFIAKLKEIAIDEE
ncbi:hypothetical protein CYY_005765 [Polysphondylium violaceum]|uniref:SWAP/Surp domain-containing protein n=1 Tax=Polysphondylium violaceum TaxID=133409 RepID=A0A8J4PSC6_9MYCE|nr:hypothetical protein CYY_005765 [Polysphondylium violaceum]